VGLTEQLMSRLREKRMDDVHVVVGGVIPEADIEPLKQLGAAAVFPGGTPLEAIVAKLRSLVTVA
jgi:methylmalonyl-CoA mutase C-terminal domain/subunit